MKLGIVSDVHSNLPAFMSVLEHMESQGVDKRISLGDTVGYGPFPNECVDLTLSHFNFILKGNHDEASYDTETASYMNPLAKTAIEWTSKKLTKENKETLKNLEYGFVTEDGIMFVHGSPEAPFQYISRIANAINAFMNPIEDFQIAFVGHTHVPAVWQTEDHKSAYVEPEFNTNHNTISEWEHYIGTERTIVNVGSVGQPRDNDPRASYAIFDTETNHLKIFKIPYAIDKTVAKMQQAQLPMDLWLRIMYGR
ncbi:metallophosphoesterase family protein [Paenibacillus illinoisensis]|uniref:metallophosphoesterase family protein n=1 Tax=Paenibacillus illinoisensis TaxID=59845 RepID=UPI003018E53E